MLVQAVVEMVAVEMVAAMMAVMTVVTTAVVDVAMLRSETPTVTSSSGSLTSSTASGSLEVQPYSHHQ